MTPEQEINLSIQAKLILDDELVQRALNDTEAAIVAQWCDLAVTDKVQAEELKRLLWAAKQFRAIFETLIANGSVAKNELLLTETMKIKQQAALERMRNG